MKKEQLFAIHTELTGLALALMKQKNADYSKDGALGNFYVCETLQLAPAEVGILVRVSDKLSRLSSILQKGEAAVKNESCRDTIIDVINYMVLLAAVLKDKDASEMARDALAPFLPAQT